MISFRQYIYLKYFNCQYDGLVDFYGQYDVLMDFNGQNDCLMDSNVQYDVRLGQYNGLVDYTGQYDALMDYNDQYNNLVDYGAKNQDESCRSCVHPKTGPIEKCSKMLTAWCCSWCDECLKVGRNWSVSGLEDNHRCFKCNALSYKKPVKRQ